MSSNTSSVQVLLKADYTQQTIISVPLEPPGLGPLEPSSVRARTILLGLSTNTITYARFGSLLHWWQAFPVPSFFPAPYNDRSLYGIVAAWGYAEVVESGIPSMAPGTVVWGYWPASTHPVDLRLVPAAVPGHWLETSGHRRKLMPLYRRYMACDPSLKLSAGPAAPDWEGLAMDALLRSLWETAHLLSRFSLSTGVRDVPVHPFGNHEVWTAEDADLSSTVVVVLAAAGKVALLFAHELGRERPAGTGPLAVVGITSEESLDFVSATGLYTKTVTYQQLDGPDAEALAAIDQVPARRVLVVDFGARFNAVGKLHAAFQAHPRPGGACFIGLALALEAKVLTPEEMVAAMAAATRLGVIWVNTSAMRAEAMEQMGEDGYFAEMLRAWQAIKAGGGLPYWKLLWGKGISGETGVEGFWSRLCSGHVGGREGLVVRLDG